MAKRTEESGGRRRAQPGLGVATAILATLATCTMQAGAQGVNQVTGVSPASAAQGTSGLTVTFSLDTDTPKAPPTNAPLPTVTLGSMTGTAVTHASQYTVTARFDVPPGEAVGWRDAAVAFALPTPPGGTLTFSKSQAFQVTAGPGVAAAFTGDPTAGPAPLTVAFTDASTGEVSSRRWDFGDGSTSAASSVSHTYVNPGSFTVSLTVFGTNGSHTLTRSGYVSVSAAASVGGYVIVDTGQTQCYDAASAVAPPAPGQAFYGQDAQCAGAQPAYTVSGDGLTVRDNRTGLTWQRSPDTTGDGSLTAGDKLNWANAQLRPAALNVAGYGGFSDWRLPTIKELYSLIDFRGTDPSALSGDTSGLVPFIDTNAFLFAYGDTGAGERIIDSQYASSTRYVSEVDESLLFGVNFADGRIKGYGLTINGADKTFFVQCVRGNPSYGVNQFVDNGDQTVTDRASGLMWAKADSGVGLTWEQALAWVQDRNAAGHLGHGDWRLPNAKELQSIVDYTRSPDTSSSAAIDPVFACTPITNEEYQADYPWYWSGTTHANFGGSGSAGAYVCFGRGLGYMNGTWRDIHGAGCQRSDPKASLSGYTAQDNGYYSSRAPQGDAVRVLNHVRLVRDAPVSTPWRFAFVGDTHTPLSGIPSEIASAVVSDRVQLLVVAGDLVQSGAGASTNALSAQLAAWRAALAPVYEAGIPVYIVRGNHESDVAGGLAAWNRFFSGANAMPGNGPAGESNLTYSVAHSNALFVALDHYANSHRVAASWLGQQLAAKRLPHVFVFGHEPAFKAFHTDCLDDYPADRNAFWACLADAGARVYLCGHDHLFNVARIDDGDGDAGDDLYQFAVGTGGSTNWPPSAYHYNGDNTPYTPVNVTNVTQSYGYLLVEVSGPGSGDLGVTLTWKQRTYDTNAAAYVYAAAADLLSYTAVDRYADSVGDGVSDWWRAVHFGGDGTTTDSVSCATCDPDGDGMDNRGEYLADTQPRNAASYLGFTDLAASGSAVEIAWHGGAGAWQYLERCDDLTAASLDWVGVFTSAPPTAVTNRCLRPMPAGTAGFFRLRCRR